MSEATLDATLRAEISRLICCTRHNDFCRDVGGDLGCKCGRGQMPSPGACIASDAQIELSGIGALADKVIAAVRASDWLFP